MMSSSSSCAMSQHGRLPTTTLNPRCSVAEAISTPPKAPFLVTCVKAVAALKRASVDPQYPWTNKCAFIAALGSANQSTTRQTAACGPIASPNRSLSPSPWLAVCRICAKATRQQSTQRSQLAERSAILSPERPSSPSQRRKSSCCFFLTHSTQGRDCWQMSGQRSGLALLPVVY